MKKLIIAVSMLSITACANLPKKNIDTLSQTNGTGSVAIATSFFGNSSSFPCQRFYLNMYQNTPTADHQTVNQFKTEYVSLNFYPSEDQFVVFDNIKPGSYVIREIKCYPSSRYVFNKNKKYIQLTAWSEFEIVANKITLSKDAFYGNIAGNGRFFVKFDAQEDNVALLKHLVKIPEGTGWTFFVDSPKASLPN